MMDNMEITTSEVKSVALWIGKLVAAEVNYLGSVRDKVERLSTELQILAAFLNETSAPSRDGGGFETGRWAISLGRDISYDCEDVIETYMAKVARHGYEQHEGFQCGSIIRYAFLLRSAIPAHGVGSSIDELNGRLASLRSAITSYVVPAMLKAASEHRSPEPDRSFYAPGEEEFPTVGFEDHSKDLKDTLATLEDRTVIAISGMGGVGKSTLAKVLYRHYLGLIGTQGSFKAVGWATAPRQFNEKQVLETLLYSLVPEKNREKRRTIYEDIKHKGLLTTLRDLMAQEKCLVIIDNIWNPEDLAMLPTEEGKAAGSRIILTTRNEIKRVDPPNEIIASRLGLSEVHVHRVRPLGDEDSMKLFEMIALPAPAPAQDPGSSTGTEGAIPNLDEKRTLGKQMLEHCDGVPLAIVVLGKSLRGKRILEWRQLCNNIKRQIERGGPATVAYKTVYDVLEISYDELPSHLKNCFLHLANFPEDYEISTDKLYKLWVGEGIVVTEDTDYESEEHTAERYLNQLVSRNMVQVASLDEKKRIKACRLHDLMRVVCIRIARREGFVQTKCSSTTLLSDTIRSNHWLSTELPTRDKRVRHVAVFLGGESPAASRNDEPPFAKVSRAPNLRSLLIFPPCEQPHAEDFKRFIKAIVEDYPLLRVFDCEDYGMKGRVPAKVKRLIHLRYLGLAKTCVSTLPSSIENLQWLQTLDLRVRFHHGWVLSIPNVLWKMKQLRHIYLPYYGDLLISPQNTIRDVPQRYSIRGRGGKLLLDGLWNLQTLLHLDLDRVYLNGVPKLEKLRRLSAVCETNIEALHAFLNCSGLESFTLQLRTSILQQNPVILSSCEAIDTLDLFDKPHWPPVVNGLTSPFDLNMFPNSLVSLGVWYHLFSENPFEVLEGLPNLHYLGLAMCYDGKEMACSDGGFPKLTEMCLDGLSKVSRWEVSNEALRNLKSLLIINCRKLQLPDNLPTSVNVQRQECGKESDEE